MSILELARTDADDFMAAFLKAFNEANDFEMEADNVYEIEELDEEDVVEIDGHKVYLKLEYSEGGGEGDGSHVERVMTVNIDGKVEAYVRATGYYESYNGTEWNSGWELVEPREVVVTQYFPVKS
jgi:hypothetical protein